MSFLPILRVFFTATSGLREAELRAPPGSSSAAFDTNVTDVASALPNAPNIGR